MSIMTREEMANKLRSGKETLIYNGRLLRTIADIPSDVELAKGNPESEKKVKDSIMLQIEELNRKLAKLSEENEKAKASTDEKNTKGRKAAEEKPANTVV